MTLVLHEEALIDQAAHGAVQNELEAYLAKNRRTFRRELIEDINNRWHPSNVVWTSTLYNVMRILSDPESYEIRDRNGDTGSHHILPHRFLRILHEDPDRCLKVSPCRSS